MPHHVMTTCMLLLAALPLSTSVACGAAQSVASKPSGIQGQVIGQDKDRRFVGLVGGATIEVKNQSGAVVLQSTSKPDGQFQLQLPPGRYFYKVTAPGYKDEDAGRGFQVERSAGLQTFHFALQQGQTDPNRETPELPTVTVGTLRGRVFEKTPQADVGIPEATVVLRREGSQELVRVVTIGPRQNPQDVGRYEVVLQAGTWHASVVARGFARFSDATPIQVAADANTERDFVLRRDLPPPPTDQGIKGLVRAVGTNDTAVTLPQNVQLQVVTAAAGQPVGDPFAPDANGGFRRELAQGNYRVIARAKGFLPALSRPAWVVKDRFTRVDVTLRAGELRPIRVVVHEHVDRGKDTRPLPAATVVVHSAGQRLSARHVTADAEGSAEFLLMPGAHVAQAAKDGYVPQRVDFRVGEGQPGEVRLVLTRTDDSTPHPEPAPETELKVDVNVVDLQTKQPIALADVLLRREGQALTEAARGQTDAEGVTRLRVVAGDYLALARKAGYRSGGVKMEIAPEQPNRSQIALKKRKEPVPPTPTQPVEPEPPQSLPVDIHGYVVYRDSTSNTGIRGVRDAKLLWRNLSQSSTGVASATSSPRGEYSIRLAEGEYTVFIQPPDRFEARTETVVVKRGMKPHYFYLNPPGQPSDGLTYVSGVVAFRDPAKRSGKTGIPESWMEWQRADGVTRFTRAAAQGRYRLNIAAGTYQVTVTPPRGYRRTSETVVVRQGANTQDFVLERSDRPSTEPTDAELVTVTGWVVTPNRTRAYTRRVAKPSGIPDWTNYQPVPAATTVWEFPTEGRLPGAVRLSRADRNGRFEIQLPRKLYATTTEATGYSPLRQRVAVQQRMPPLWLVLQPTVTPSQRTTLTLRTMERRRSGSVSQSVPLAAVDIAIRQGNRFIAKGKSGKDGRYSLQLPAGSYDIVVARQGYIGQPGRVTVSDGSAIHEVFLTRALGPQPEPPDTPATQLTLTVSTVESRRVGRITRKLPVPSADISITQAGRSVAKGRSGSNGRYAVRLPAGTYDVVVAKQGYIGQPRRLTLSTRSTAHELVLTRAGGSQPGPSDSPSVKKQRVTLRVVEMMKREIPLAMASVTVMQGSTRIATGRTNSSGVYQVSLAPGQYQFKATRPGFGSGGTVVTVQNATVSQKLQLTRLKTSK